MHRILRLVISPSPPPLFEACGGQGREAAIRLNFSKRALLFSTAAAQEGATQVSAEILLQSVYYSILLSESLNLQRIVQIVTLPFLNQVLT